MLLDTLIVIGLIGCIGLGLALGVVRQFFILIGVYLGLILAYFVHPQLGSFMATAAAQPHWDPFFPPAAYLLVLFLTMLVVILFSFREYQHKPEGGLFTRDRLGGAVVAFIWGLFLISGVLMAVEFFAISNAPVGDEARESFLRFLLASRLRPLLLDDLPGFRDAVRLWSPTPR